MRLMISIAPLNVYLLALIQFWNSGFSTKQPYLQEIFLMTVRWPTRLRSGIWRWTVHEIWSSACLYCKCVFCSINKVFLLARQSVCLFPPLFATFWLATGSFRGGSTLGFIKGPGKKCSLTLLVAKNHELSVCVYRSAANQTFYSWFYCFQFQRQWLSSPRQNHRPQFVL
jgi:hypothetical protein